ncbi:DgyrCDS9005 [Dimorphilus gyrociliatus]|uniref:DgyrCDS9005 n=1 Tax=Dimorphilus gyrociliatus TaxID=2664684 RepID=A0A7I8VXI6_9ANNE|nr:DgyrCDS9005 [Dimorphilus gyrociliatus]
MSNYRIKGLVAAVFTPFDDNQYVNYGIIDKYAEKLSSINVKNVFVNGSTGEGLSLSVEERNKLSEHWMNVKEKNNLENVIIHVGAESVKDACRLARFCNEKHVDAISAMAPTYFKPETIDDLIDYCSRVASEAPNIPFYYYHIPMRTNIQLCMKEFLWTAAKRIPNLRGLKYSHWNLSEINLCRMIDNGKYNILYGMDEQLLGAMVFGIDAAIGSTYNYIGNVYTELISSFEDGNLKKALEIQTFAQEFLEIIFENGRGITSLKTFTSFFLDINLGPVRCPLKSVDRNSIIDNSLPKIKSLMEKYNNKYKLKTGDARPSATNVRLRMIAYDNMGIHVDEIPVEVMDPQPGHTDVFQAESWDQLSSVTELEIWRDPNDSDADWLCDVITVHSRAKGLITHFPIGRWLKAGRRIRVKRNDTSLPQNDAHAKLREAELIENRSSHQYAQLVAHAPLQQRDVIDTSSELAPFWDLIRRKTELLAQYGLARTTSTSFAGFDEVVQLFDGPGGLPTPACKSDWSSDCCFGAQRLAGCLPTSICLCHSLPDRLPVTHDMLKPFLEGWSVKQIIQARRLFFVDHSHLLEGVTTVPGRHLCDAAIGLFFVSGDKKLQPIAIQLERDGPVFFPSDPKLTWIAAKMWFNHADATLSFCLWRFGITHMMMEGISVALQRHLAPSHPLHRLLYPHLAHIPSLNRRVVNELLSESGWAERNLSVGRKGTLELCIRAAEAWCLDIQGCVPRELEQRGLLDLNVLPNYSYRDEAIPLHKVMNSYVTKVIKIYYKDMDSVIKDYELQQFIGELARERSFGGIGVNGLPPSVKTQDEIIKIATGIIWTCTGVHAATSLPLYDHCAFPPSYPLLLKGSPPRTKQPITEDELCSFIPSKQVTCETAALTKLISNTEARSLGEDHAHYEPMCIQAVKEFQQDLAQLSEASKLREQKRKENPTLKYSYPYLDPQHIPNRASDPQLKRFVETETQRQKFQEIVHSLTDHCWDACMGTPSNRLEKKTETCLTNCVNRFIDASNFIINRMEKEGEALMSKQLKDPESIGSWSALK